MGDGKETNVQRRFALSGAAAGNIEGVALGAKKVGRKRDFLNLKAFAAAEDDDEEVEAGNEVQEGKNADGGDELHQELLDELHAAFVAGMIIGKEAPEMVPDFDDELSVLEHEFIEALEEAHGAGKRGDDEGDGEEAAYAAPTGKQLMPSKKNPKVRRWQRVGNAAVNLYQTAHRAGALVHGGIAAGKLATGDVVGAAQHAARAAVHGGESAEVSAIKDAVKAGREAKGGKLKKVGVGVKEFAKKSNIRGALPTAAALTSLGVAGGAALGPATALGLGIGGATYATGKAIHGVDKLVGHFAKDKRHSHKYWQKKQGWAVKRIAEKSGISERAAAKTLANLYAHHAGQGMSKGMAHKKALTQALSGEGAK